MEIAAILAREVLTIFLLISAGIVCKRFHILDEENARSICNLLLTIVMPIMIVNAFQTERVAEMIPNLLFCLVFCIAFHLVCIFIAGRVFRDIGKGGTKYKVSRVASVLSNCGFMGFPLLLATVGEVGLLYGAIFMGIFNVFSWAWCAPMLSGQKFSPVHLVRNPGLVGFVIGFVLYLCNIRLPAALGSAIGHLSAINTPLSMLVIGVFLSSVNIREAVRDSDVYKTVALRNILFPALTLLALWALRVTAWMPGGKVFALSVMVMVSCSTAASAILMPARYRADSSHGAKLVLASTLVTILTLPLIVALSDYIL